MISYLEKPHNKKDLANVLHPFVKEWFFNTFKEFSLPQLYGVMEIHNKNNILISAPTGGTKTLTSTLSIINELVILADRNELKDQVYCIYTNPLRALSRDLEVNLNKPLEEIKKIAKKQGKELDIRIASRTGDTTPYERSKMLKKPPHILICTPETLSIVLTTVKFRELLKNVEYVIVDEIHALAENKRGSHLSLSLERLEYLSKFVRIGLSATISPLDEIAKFLTGGRKCKIANVGFLKKYDLKVISPVPNLIDVEYEDLNSSLYKLMDDLIQKHKTTLIFTNTRSATERVVHHLKENFPKNYTENIDAHHGSLSKEHRHNVEDRLRKGELKSVVCLEGNTKILNSKGKWIKIKDLHTDYVQSLDKNLKLNNNKIITKIIKENTDKLLKLKTQFGKEVTCTKEHKFLTINNQGSTEWKEAQQIKQGEFVATIRNYNYKIYTNKELKELTFSNYPDDGYVELKKEFLNNIKKQIISKSQKIKYFWEENLKSECSYSTLIHSLGGNYLFKLRFIRKISKKLGIDNLDIFENIVSLSSTKVKNSRIEITRELMRLLGFMCADGYVSNTALFVSNRNKKLLDYYRELIKNLSGRNCSEKLGSTGTPIIFWNSVFLSKFLKSLGFKVGRKARILTIPDFIFRLDKDLVSSFISGYFDGDGYLEIKSKDKRVYSAGFCTTSKQMTEDLNRLLLREGMISSIRSQYINKVQRLKEGRSIKKKGWFYDVSLLGGEHIRKFASFINPKRDNLKYIKEILKLNGYCNFDVIPNLGVKLRKIRKNFGITGYRLQKTGKTNPTKYELGIRNISRNKLIELRKLFKNKDRDLLDFSNSDLFWEKIVLKKRIKPTDFVYNIEVKNDHNYVANSFITKNCSTSLELGIDIGYIDLVICLGSPKSIARFMQRAGRSGHKMHEKVKARMIVLDRDDLVECSVILKNAIEKKIDKIHIPKLALDVLAQQIHGIAISEQIHIDELFKLVKGSYVYEKLSKEDFMQVIDYLSGKYISLEDRYVYAKIWYNEETGFIGKKGKMSRVIHLTNIGTIPDQTRVLVKMKNEMIGSIDESFLEKLRPGDVFILGGRRYVFRYSSGMVAQVVATADRNPTVPSWFSEMLPLSFDLSMEIQKFRKYMEERFKEGKNKKEIMKFINEYLYVEENASNSIYEYFKEQFKFAEIPHEKKLLVEFFKEYDKSYVIFHSLYGRRVNDVLSRGIAYAVSRLQHRDVEIGINDNGFYISSRDKKKIQVLRAFNLLKSEELRQVMEKAIDKTEVLKRRFRHCATRSLMILRQYKGKRKGVGRQQVSSMILMNAVKRISENFSMLKEARREVLEDLMDIENAVRVLKDIERGKIKIKQISSSLPSPFAFNLISQGFTDIFKMEDKVEFLRKMHKRILNEIE